MQAHASGDFHILQDLIHQLKGSGGQAGFPEITELAGKIELNINNNELDDLRHNLTRRLLRPAAETVRIPGLFIQP